MGMQLLLLVAMPFYSGHTTSPGIHDNVCDDVKTVRASLSRDICYSSAYRMVGTPGATRERVLWAQAKLLVGETVTRIPCVDVTYEIECKCNRIGASVATKQEPYEFAHLVYAMSHMMLRPSVHMHEPTMASDTVHRQFIGEKDLAGCPGENCSRQTDRSVAERSTDELRIA
jgi:hypothetical protein